MQVLSLAGAGTSSSWRSDMSRSVWWREEDSGRSSTRRSVAGGAGSLRRARRRPFSIELDLPQPGAGTAWPCSHSNSSATGSAVPVSAALSDEVGIGMPGVAALQQCGLSVPVRQRQRRASGVYSRTRLRSRCRAARMRHGSLAADRPSTCSESLPPTGRGTRMRRLLPSAASRSRMPAASWRAEGQSNDRSADSMVQGWPAGAARCASGCRCRDVRQPVRQIWRAVSRSPRGPESTSPRWAAISASASLVEGALSQAPGFGQVAEPELDPAQAVPYEGISRQQLQCAPDQLARFHEVLLAVGQRVAERVVGMA